MPMSRLMVVGVLTLAACTAVLLLLWAAQRRLIYFPLEDLPAPAEMGLTGVEPVTLETADGLRLGGWFMRASRAEPRATVLVFNGNAGNRAYRAPLAVALRRRGLHVLLFDYRGYGGNAGTPTEEGLADDARAALAYLTARSDVDGGRVVFFGESLGTAVAARLATEHPPAALILRSPFTSLAAVGQFHYPWLPVRRLLLDRYDTVARIPQVRSPVLVIAGERDRIVPMELSRRVFNAAAQPKTLVVLPGADHNDVDLLAGDAMLSAIDRFLAEQLNAPGEAE